MLEIPKALNTVFYSATLLCLFSKANGSESNNVTVKILEMNNGQSAGNQNNVLYYELDPQRLYVIDRLIIIIR